jgi:hypothetical protein
MVKIARVFWKLKGKSFCLLKRLGRTKFMPKARLLPAEEA